MHTASLPKRNLPKSKFTTSRLATVRPRGRRRAPVDVRLFLLLAFLAAANLAFGVAVLASPLAALVSLRLIAGATLVLAGALGMAASVVSEGR